MNTAVSELLTQLQEIGVELSLEGDLLKYEAPRGVMTPEIHKHIRVHKADLLEYLKQEFQTILQAVSTWPQARRGQFDGLVQAYQNPDRGFGIRVRSRSRKEAIHKAFRELEPIVKREIQTIQTER